MVKHEYYDSLVPVINKALGIQLYDWQIDYIKGISSYPPSGRGNGRTLAYCLRLMLWQNETPIPINDIDIVDQYTGSQFMYHRWFVKFFFEIYNKLSARGIPLRPVEKKSARKIRLER